METNVDFQVPHTPALLQLASEGKPLPLHGDCLLLVQTLLKAGYVRAKIVPSENATELVCVLTPEGDAFLKWMSE
jgi:hypothetical protein